MSTREMQSRDFNGFPFVRFIKMHWNCYLLLVVHSSSYTCIIPYAQHKWIEQKEFVWLVIMHSHTIKTFQTAYFIYSSVLNCNKIVLVFYSNFFLLFVFVCSLFQRRHKKKTLHAEMKPERANEAFQSRRPDYYRWHMNAHQTERRRKKNERNPSCWLSVLFFGFSDIYDCICWVFIAHGQ